ncbi:MAG: toxin-activating lysine-acyltransferase [Pseudomonadota bacterium]
MTGQKKSPRQEYPSPDKLRVYGDFAFLAMRSLHHSQMSMGQFRRAIEPAVELGQYRIWRFDDVPRAAITWAWLSEETERAFVRDRRLDPNAWDSGDRLWLVELIAPYPGLAHQIARWAMIPGQFAERSFTFLRVREGDDVRRIVEIDFERASKARIMTAEAFLR